MSDTFNPAEFGAAWQKFIEYINEHTPPDGPTPPMLLDRIKTFLEDDPSQMVIVKQDFPDRDLPNLQIAFDHFLTGPNRSAEQTGYLADHDYPGFSISSILTRPHRWQSVTEGPVQYRSVELADGSHMQCVERGLYFIRDGETKLVAFIRGAENYFGGRAVGLEILCPLTEKAEAMLAELRKLLNEHNVYRGHVISLGGRDGDQVAFRTLPEIKRDGIVLPETLLDVIERNTLGFVANAPPPPRRGPPHQTRLVVSRPTRRRQNSHRHVSAGANERPHPHPTHRARHGVSGAGLPVGARPCAFGHRA